MKFVLKPYNLKKTNMDIRNFITYFVVWVASNLSIPFWVVGHIHLTINVYEDIHELIMSLGMNIIVLIGFLIEWKKFKKDNSI